MDNPLGSAPAALFDACLVVEDDSIIRLDLEETLRGFGLRCVHGASTLEAAMEIARTADISFAVLDFDLGRDNSVAVAELLLAKGIPAVFLSGYGKAIELPPSLLHLQVVAKPFSTALLAEALLIAFAAQGKPRAVSCGGMAG